MELEIDRFPRIDLVHFQPMQNFEQKMQHVVDVVARLRHYAVTAFAGSRFLELRGHAAQIIKQDEQIANKRFLQRVAHEVVPVTNRFLMQRIEQFLVDGFVVADGRELLVELLESCGKKIGRWAAGRAFERFQFLPQRIL